MHARRQHACVPVPRVLARVLGAQGLRAPARQLRQLLLIPLRAPSVAFSALSLYFLCVRPTLPSTLVEMRAGVEDGMKALAAQRRNAAGELLSTELEALRRAASAIGRATTIVQAARLSTLAVGCLAALEAASRSAVSAIRLDAARAAAAAVPSAATGT